MQTASVFSSFLADTLKAGNVCVIATDLHALTLWGIDMDESSGLITKMYLTDSDNRSEGNSELLTFDVSLRTEDGQEWLAVNDYGILRKAYVLSPEIGDALALIPEPSAFLLSLAGLVGVAMVRKRRIY